MKSRAVGGARTPVGADAAALPALPGGSRLKLSTIPADGDGATGGRVWHSAPVLCSWLGSAAGLAALRGRAVLELGSGTGACGLYAAALGAAHVTLSDGGSPPLLALLSRNIRQNGSLLPSGGAVRAAPLCWGCEVAALPDGPCDLILGSDVIYDPASHRALCETLRTLMRRELARGRAAPRAVLASMPRKRVQLQTPRAGSPEPEAAGGEELYSDAAAVSFEAAAAAHALRVAPLSSGAGGPMSTAWTARQWRDATPFLLEVALET